MNKKVVGNMGELSAAIFLEESGYKIIDTNVRPLSGMHRGEIDIIAWDGDILCIIEVKTRNSHRFDANETITVGKRRQLTRLAVAYMTHHNIIQTECRFDVICVYNQTDSSDIEFDLTRGAFDPVYASTR